MSKKHQFLQLPSGVIYPGSNLTYMKRQVTFRAHLLHAKTNALQVQLGFQHEKYYDHRSLQADNCRSSGQLSLQLDVSIFEPTFSNWPMDELLSGHKSKQTGFIETTYSSRVNKTVVCNAQYCTHSYCAAAQGNSFQVRLALKHAYFQVYIELLDHRRNQPPSLLYLQ